MKIMPKIGPMMQYLPGPVKDAVHAAAQVAGKKTDELDLARKGFTSENEVTPELKGKRQRKSYISARTIDRDGEIVIPESLDLSEYMKYGSVLCNHNYSNLPVGSCKSILSDSRGILALTDYADTGEGTLANVVWHLVEQGHLRGKSVGFVPLETVSPGELAWDKVANKLQREWKEFSKDVAEKSVSRIITKGVLLEYSVVSVPCNPDAMDLIQVVKGLKVTDRAVFKSLNWEPVDEGGILVPRVIARPVRQVVVLKSEGQVPVTKGEEEGHPFRGNQYTNGQAGAGAETNGRLAAEVTGGEHVGTDGLGRSLFHRIAAENPGEAASALHAFLTGDESGGVMTRITSPKTHGKSGWRVSATNSDTGKFEHFNFYKAGDKRGSYTSQDYLDASQGKGLKENKEEPKATARVVKVLTRQERVVKVVGVDVAAIAAEAVLKARGKLD